MDCSKHFGLTQLAILLLCIFATTTARAEITEQAAAPEQTVTIPTPEELFELPDFINNIIDERISPLKQKEARLKALLDLVYDDTALNLQYANDITRTPMQAIRYRRGNCVSLSFTFAAMARRAGLKVHFMESSDPGRWKQVGEHYALERHMTVYLPIRNAKTRGYHVDFQYAEPEHLRHKKLSDVRAISDFYNNRAVEFLMDHNLEAAQEFAVEAIKMDKSYDANWLNYGLIQRRLGRLDEAIRAYETAIKINKKNLSAYNNLAVVYKQLGDEQQAKIMKNKVTEHRLKNPFYLHDFGEIKIQQKDYYKAIEYFKKAIKADKKIPGFYLSLAEAYYLTGELDKAIKTISKGQKFTTDPDQKTRLHYTKEFLIKQLAGR